MTTLVEYWESGNAPHEALGRAARRLSNGGAIYLGGGIGIEKQRKGDADLYSVVDGTAKAQTYTGPLSAVIAAFSKSGASTAPDSPGGETSVTDPAAAARLRELKDEEAEARRDIDRMESRQRRRAKDASTVFMPGGLGDDGWEARRIGELKSDLSRIAAERERLLATGNVEEVEQARPGTNFTKIPPANVAKLKGIIEHYKGMAHGFTACVRDQVKHGLSEDHANRRCAVVKDLGQQSTKWRKGGGASGKVSEECDALLTAALGRVGVCVEQLGLASTVALVEGVAGDVPSFVESLAEGVREDFVLLAMAGHPLALVAFGIEEAFGGSKSAAPNAQRDAARRSGQPVRKPGQGGPPRAPGAGAFDESKHKRGSAGTSQGGKFVTKGSSGEDVRAVQHRVGASPDGKYGEHTKRAVMDFQKRHGLQVDGVVGHQTAVALAGHDGKSAQVGELKGSDRAKLARLRKGGTSLRPRGRRARGGTVV